MEYQPEDYDVGLLAGWECLACGHVDLFCTQQPLVLLLLEFRFGHRICSRIRRRCTFAR